MLGGSGHVELPGQLGVAILCMRATVDAKRNPSPSCYLSTELQPWICRLKAASTSVRLTG